MRIMEMVEELGLEKTLYFLGLPKKYEVELHSKSDNFLKAYIKHDGKTMYFCHEHYEVDHWNHGGPFVTQVIDKGEVVKGSFKSYMREENREDSDYADDWFSTIKWLVMLKVLKGYLQ